MTVQQRTAPKSTDPKPNRWLTRRREFLAAAKGRRHHAALFTIQALRRSPLEGPARFGLTVTGKTGNAVERNRIKRRLRAAIQAVGRKMPPMELILYLSVVATFSKRPTPLCSQNYLTD